MTERITFQTTDRVEIVGDYYPVAGPAEAGVLFLHMMPADRSSWQSLASKFKAAGFSCLAIDLRGHGESVNKDGQTLDFHLFSDQDHQASRLDVEAAANWLINHGTRPDRLIIVGASIGANLALEFLANPPASPAAAALSPGLDYHGVKTEPAVRKMHAQQSLFLAASREDEYSAESAQKLYAVIEAVPKELKLFQGAGHGTAMFAAQPELEQTIVTWVASQLAK